MTAAGSPLTAFHASNMLTYCSLLFGVAAIAAAARANAGATAALMAAAVVCDTLDGRFARLFSRTPAQRACGGQLDSLSDAIAFGVAPPVSAALLHGDVPGVWLVAFIYAACAIARLAHYNVSACGDEGFVGVPVPVAALLFASGFAIPATPLALMTIGLAAAAAMVAPLPIPRPRGVALAAFLCWPLLLIALHL